MSSKAPTRFARRLWRMEDEHLRCFGVGLYGLVLIAAYLRRQELLIRNGQQITFPGAGSGQTCFFCSWLRQRRRRKGTGYLGDADGQHTHHNKFPCLRIRFPYPQVAFIYLRAHTHTKCIPKQREMRNIISFNVPFF